MSFHKLIYKSPELQETRNRIQLEIPMSYQSEDQQLLSHLGNTKEDAAMAIEDLILHLEQEPDQQKQQKQQTAGEANRRTSLTASTASAEKMDAGADRGRGSGKTDEGEPGKTLEMAGEPEGHGRSPLSAKSAREFEAIEIETVPAKHGDQANHTEGKAGAADLTALRILPLQEGEPSSTAEGRKIEMEGVNSSDNSNKNANLNTELFEATSSQEKGEENGDSEGGAKAKVTPSPNPSPSPNMEAVSNMDSKPKKIGEADGSSETTEASNPTAGGRAPRETYQNEQIISQAQAEANKIISQANEEAERLRSQAETLIQQGREEWEAQKEKLLSQISKDAKETKEKGYESGVEEAKALAKQTSSILKTAMEEKNRIIMESEKQMVDIILMVARKIIRDEYESRKELVAKNIQKALNRIKSKGHIDVRVNFRDLKIANENKAEFLTEYSQFEDIHFYEDPTVDPGGCIIETATGSIDARIETQLNKIEDSIRNTQAAV